MGSYLPQCRTCHRTKKPIGRDAPLSSNYCDHECGGYRQDPVPPSFWSREEELEHESDEARALVSNMFALQCARPDPIVGWLRPRYDHMASETLKGVQAALISWGLVKREECVRE